MQVLAYLFHQPDVRLHEAYQPRQEKLYEFWDPALH